MATKDEINPSIQEKYSLLKMSFFSEASAKELSELDKIRSFHRFRAGQRVPMSLEGSHGFYYIHDGYAQLIFRRNEIQHTIRIVGPDDLVGFARWLAPNYNYSMITISDVTASFFRKEDFMELQSRSPYLANEVTRWLMKVLTSQEDQIFTLKNTSAKARVAGTLENLRKKFGRSIGGRDSLEAAPIDRKTLADLSGVVIEVLSRTLKEFEDENIIERKGRIIFITNPKALEAIAAT